MARAATATDGVIRLATHISLAEGGEWRCRRCSSEIRIVECADRRVRIFVWRGLIIGLEAELGEIDMADQARCAECDDTARQPHATALS